LYNSYRVKTIRTATSLVMDIPTLLLLLLGSITHIFYLALAMTSYLGQLRCGERESSYRLGGFKRCVLNRESRMLEWPKFGVWKIIYLLLRMHRKPYLYPNFCYTLSLVHFKVCIRMLIWTYPIP
jgi:hypothetical protein